MRFFEAVAFGILLLTLGGVSAGQQPDEAVPAKVEVSRIPSALVNKYHGMLAAASSDTCADEAAPKLHTNAKF